jgi:hypothetical protein
MAGIDDYIAAVPHAGLMVDTPEAAVYALRQAGQLTGLLISSEGTGAAGDSSGED